MREAVQSVLARRLEVISGMLALVAGLIVIGTQLFAPLMTVDVTREGRHYIQQASRWEVFNGFIFSLLGLAALGLCLLCVLAIGYGAYAHGVRYEARGRLVLWISTALLALVIMLAMTVLSFDSFFPMTLVAPYLLPSLGLALLASGAAAT
jgi:cbb3-type cytochrome oxidase subunit 3